MKIQFKSFAAVAIATWSTLAGCSSLPGASESGKEISQNGPTVMNVHSQPSTVELNRELHPFQRPEILADVKDFDSKVNKVTLKFVNVPVEVAMQNIGGTTWRAELTPDQLRKLAVSGKTIKYDVIVEARDSKNRMAVSPSPITVAIKTPDLTKNVG